MGGDSRDAKRLRDSDVEAHDRLDEEGAVSRPHPRDTVRPSFDVERYAEETIGRERLPTIVDEAATEEARIASVLMDSTPPPPSPEAPEIHVAVRYSEIEALEDDQQLAFLRARLAPLTRVPALTRKITELGPLIEDPKMAYVLGFIDGLLPLVTIVEVAGLPEIDTLRILDRAVDHYVITFRPKAESGALG